VKDSKDLLSEPDDAESIPEEYAESRQHAASPTDDDDDDGGSSISWFSEGALTLLVLSFSNL